MSMRKLRAVVEIEVRDTDDGEVDELPASEFTEGIEFSLDTSNNIELLAGSGLMVTMSGVKVKEIAWLEP